MGESEEKLKSFGEALAKGLNDKFVIGDFKEYEKRYSVSLVWFLEDDKRGNDFKKVSLKKVLEHLLIFLLKRITR